MKGVHKMSVFTNIKSLVRSFKALLAMVGFFSLSLGSNAQTPSAKGNTHIIDKSKLTIHQNFRDEQPQRFDNKRSKIVEFVSDKHNSKLSSSKNPAIHTKGITTTSKKEAEIKREKAAKAKAIHHKIKRKALKTH